MGLFQSKPQKFDADHKLSAPLRSTLKDVEHLFIRPQRLKIKEGSQLGFGGYGEVMFAKLDKSRKVAVKQLRAVGTKSDRKRQAYRLVRELKIWATLQHPNILGLLGFYLSEDYEVAQLISVYMVNGNVSQYLKQNQPDIVTRLKFVQGITSGLQYLHEFNPPISHGDLKPANVLISDELDAVICDFGVASFVNQAAGPSGLTTTQAVKGSLRYMSPELFDGEVRHTLPSDIWAWACTIYQIFTNIEPYSETKTNLAVIVKVSRGTAPGSIQVLLSRLPQDLKWATRLSEVINDCWNFDSSKRPSVTTLIGATSDTSGSRQLDMPFEPQLYPLIHQRQRSVFKRIDCPHLKNGDRSSLKLSASISLPDLTASIPPQPTELDQESPHSPAAPIRFRRLRCYSLGELQNGISLRELRDGLLSTNGKPSAKIQALDCTNRLSERTEIKGIGAYSDVSQAKLDKRLVAVKALRPTGIEGTDEIRMRKRLGREIYVWAGLRHPNILEFFGFAFEGGGLCLISSWCERGTLSGYLKRHRSVDRGSLVWQVAEGLKYLHLQNPPVIHGSLMTANVLITGDHIVKICGFGGSKRLGEGGTGFTTDDLVRATPRYSAPEILQESGYHTLQSDVYSFACVALETLSRKYPFWKISNLARIINKVVFEMETPSPGDHPDLTDDRLWELLRQCWSYKPSDRPRMFAVCRKLAIEGYRPSHHLLAPSI